MSPPSSPPFPPPFTPFLSLPPLGILCTARALLTRTSQLHNHLAASLTPETATFSNLIRPLIDDTNTAAGTLCVLGRLLAAVSSDAKIRTAAREVQKLVAAAEDERFARADIALLVDAVRRQKGEGGAAADEHEGWGPEESHLVDWLYGQYARAGAAAGNADITARVCVLRAEVKELCLAAVGALAEADDGMWFTREELEGVPESGLSGLKMEKGNGEGGEERDRLWVPFRGAYDVNILRDAVRPETRRKYDIASDRRFPENVGRLERIAELRDEIARLLGYANHAELAMEDKMSRYVDEVMEELRAIQEKLQPLRDLEIQRLLSLKRRYVSDQKRILDVDDMKLYAWDWVFYASKQRQESYAVETKKITEYFEAEHTFMRMLKVFEDLFGMDFEETEATTWHEDVHVFIAHDSESEGGAFLGYLYADLYDRPGKHQTNMHIAVQRGFIEASATTHYPMSALICTIPRPAPGQLALLRHGQVITLFHELGHCIHNLVSRTKYGLPPPVDFVEVPSLVLEQWASVPEVLISLSRHYTAVEVRHVPDTSRGTGDVAEMGNASLPQDLAESVAHTRSVNMAHDMLVMIQRALFDLTIHSPACHQAAVDMNTTSLWNSSRRDVVGLCLSEDPDERSLAHGEFGHIFRKYDAGFFAYPMSTIWAADLYTHAFADQPMDPAAGRRYRYAVLQAGSSIPPMETLERFLGRKLSVEPLFAKLTLNG